MKKLMKGLGILMVSVFLPGISFNGIADEIEPGINITQDNYQQYLPELEKLIDPGNYQLYLDYLEGGFIKIPVHKKKEYPCFIPLDEASRKYQGTCRIGEKNELIGWKAGMPFPNPQRGVELAWDLDRKSGVPDQSTMLGDFYLVNKNFEIERRYRWRYCNYYYTGRVYVPPFHEVAGNNGKIRLKESFVILEPFDIKGFAFIRTRYEDIFSPDDVYSYIPAIRRLRRLTGSDVCDPMLGSDTIFDDFETCKNLLLP